MEIVIPPRSLANPAYRYTWNENGDVVQVRSMHGSSSGDTTEQRSNESDSQRPPKSRGGRGRRTVQWPFQNSVVTEVSAPPSPVTIQFRRATWQLPQRPGTSGTSSWRDSTLIPDYVVNFLRGETPETVARRKRNGGRLGARGVDIVEQPHKRFKSRAGLIENYAEAEDGRETRMTGMTGYADGEVMSPTFSTGTEMRQMLPSSREKRPRGWRKLAHGWRGGVALNAILAFIILVVSFICLVIAGSNIAILVGDMNLFTGSCSTATSINWGLHWLINILVVITIAGASYTFQVLSSPTRSEASAAHHSKKWLDIGVPSVRNFRFIDRSRVILSMILLIVAVATSVIFNSVIFTSQAGTSYNLVFVDQSFLTGSPFSNATANNNGGLTRAELLNLQDLAVGNELTNLTSTDCLAEFSGAFNTDFDDVLIITPTNEASSSASSLVQTALSGSNLNSYSTSTSSNINLDDSQLEFCLAQRADSSSRTCTVHINGFLLIAVVVLNLVTLIATATTLLLRRFEPLVTLGDAITSFLRDPDPATRNHCMLTKQDVWQGRWGEVKSRNWLPTNNPRWFSIPSVPRWLFTAFWWIEVTAIAAGVLSFMIKCDPAHGLSAFGVASPNNSFLLPASTNQMPVATAAIIAALPQILLAGLYFATNSLLTTYYLSHESSMYAVTGKNNAKPLRVSANPEGQQTTSLFLTLPRPISWILAFLFMAMSFVLSQSCFVVVLTSTTSRTLTGIGFSGTGLAILLGLLVGLVVLVAVLGFRKAPATVMANGQAVGNPLVLKGGSCSAVISARCHRVPGEWDVWLLPVSWGVVHGGTSGANMSHCTYSARLLAQMELSRYYA